jgi:molybdopterin-binding protein
MMQATGRFALMMLAFISLLAMGRTAHANEKITIAAASDRASLRLAVGGGQLLLSRITRRSRDMLGLAKETQVFAQVKSAALVA